MRLSLIAPGARKNNPYWLVRGFHAGRRIEMSTRTTDAAEARRFADNLERALGGSEIGQLKATVAALNRRIVCLEEELANRDARIAELERRATRRLSSPVSVGPEPLLSLAQVAMRLGGVTVKTMKRRIAEAGIRGPRIGREMMLTQDDLARLIELSRQRD